MKKLRDFLIGEFSDTPSLGKTLENESGYFLYDSSTNNIVQCELLTYRLLEKLIPGSPAKAIDTFVSQYGEDNFVSSASQIKESIESANLFSIKKASNFGLAAHYQDYKKILETGVESISLEVTEECNLRCAYCVYQDHVQEKRSYGSEFMDLKTARKAIDFLKKHSGQSNELNVSFYGGEPLFNFNFIRECVQYAEHVLTGKTIEFSITTNGTLINREIAEFLVKNDFSVLVSLDGPEEYHDQHRLDRDGKGSFKNTIRGLKFLADCHKQYKSGKISLNLVYTPPFSSGKLNKIRSFINQLDWLPLNAVTLNYPHFNSVPQYSAMLEDKAGDEPKDGYFGDWGFDEYKGDYKNSDILIRGIVEQPFGRLARRNVFVEPRDEFFLNGCCLPGQRKLYVNVDGDFEVCEKMPSGAPHIGNVETGFDLDEIQKIYIDQYATESLKDCSGCWAVRLCKLCYYSAFNSDGKLDMEKKRKYCRYQLESLEKELIQFSEILKNSPEQLEDISKIEIK